MWHALVDRTSCGPLTNWHEESQNGPELVTDAWLVGFSYIHSASGYRQYYHVGNTAQHGRLGLFQDCDFAGDLEDSTSTW